MAVAQQIQRYSNLMRMTRVLGLGIGHPNGLHAPLTLSPSGYLARAYPGRSFTDRNTSLLLVKDAAVAAEALFARQTANSRWPRGPNFVREPVII